MRSGVCLGGFRARRNRAVLTESVACLLERPLPPASGAASRSRSRGAISARLADRTRRERQIQRPAHCCSRHERKSRHARRVAKAGQSPGGGTAPDRRQTQGRPATRSPLGLPICGTRYAGGPRPAFRARADTGYQRCSYCPWLSDEQIRSSLLRLWWEANVEWTTIVVAIPTIPRDSPSLACVIPPPN